MKVLHTVPEKNVLKNPVITIGNFDGVHIGHQRILSTLSEIAGVRSGESIVLTFSSHPRRIITPDISIRHITSTDEKIALMERFHIDYMIFMDFSQDIAGLNALEFYNNYLVDRIGAKEIVIGYDHAFGKNREGDLGFLTRLSESSGIGITRIDEVILDSRPVSSTWLRDEITMGNFRAVTELLGRRYGIQGSVARGAGRGRTLGFPTANIAPHDPEKLIPGDGVYAVSVIINGKLHKPGMANIGNNPTFDQKERTIEVNIFDFDEDIYDAHITVEFHERIRDEIKFDGPDALIQQIKKDRAAALALIHG